MKCSAWLIMGHCPHGKLIERNWVKDTCLINVVSRYMIMCVIKSLIYIRNSCCIRQIAENFISLMKYKPAIDDVNISKMKSFISCTRSMQYPALTWWLKHQTTCMWKVIFHTKWVWDRGCHLTAIVEATILAHYHVVTSQQLIWNQATQDKIYQNLFPSLNYDIR